MKIYVRKINGDVKEFEGQVFSTPTCNSHADNMFFIYADGEMKEKTAFVRGVEIWTEKAVTKTDGVPKWGKGDVLVCDYGQCEVLSAYRLTDGKYAYNVESNGNLRIATQSKLEEVGYQKATKI